MFSVYEPASTLTVSPVLAAVTPRPMLPVAETNTFEAFTRTRPSDESSSLCEILSSMS